MQLASGMLLVATPALQDPNFVDTVVLLLDVTDDGALGVVLNRPSQVLVADVLEPWRDVVAEPEVLFRGGPVGTDGALAVARLRDPDEPPVGWRPVRGAARHGRPRHPHRARRRLARRDAGLRRLRRLGRRPAGRGGRGGQLVRRHRRGRRRVPRRAERAAARRHATPARNARLAREPPRRSGHELSCALGLSIMSTIGFSPGSQTVEERQTVPTDEGDHERFSHYVPKDKLTEAMVMGTPVIALCGKVWVPSRAPEKFPVCPDCKEVWESMKSGDGSGSDGSGPEA